MKLDSIRNIILIYDLCVGNIWYRGLRGNCVLVWSIMELFIL